MENKFPKIVTRRFGMIDPLSIDDFIQHDGFQGFLQAIQKSPAEIREAIKQSGLRGRGGAAFPTGIKMEATATSAPQETERFVVCNADEGEPGTFKDRYIMEKDPYALIEGMLIAGYAIGSHQGYIYIRGEYLSSITTIRHAINECYKHNWLGKNIQATGFDFNLEVFIGGGSYVCGEELTLLESLEGKRGHPRIKPPYPAQKGLWQKPTLVNNVETLVNLPYILQYGASKFREYGTAESPGTKLLSISGSVEKPGVYEVPFGISFKEALDLAGSLSKGKQLKALLVGGAAGNFIPPSLLDLPITYESLAENKLTLGSGAIMAFEDSVDLHELLQNILHFFKHESCGKCVPCRIGTTLLYEKAKEPLTQKNLAWMIEEAKYMARTSLCPLGQSPLIPLQSFERFFNL